MSLVIDDWFVACPLSIVVSIASSTIGSLGCCRSYVILLRLALLYTLAFAFRSHLRSHHVFYCLSLKPGRIVHIRLQLIGT